MAICLQCGFAVNEVGTAICERCGAFLKQGLESETTLPDLTDKLPRLADGRFIVEGFVAEIGPVQYYDVREANDPQQCYTLAVCSKEVDDPLAGVDFHSELGLATQNSNSPNPFRTEFELLSRFTSSGILRAVHCFLDDELAYLVFERIEGRRLAELAPLPETEARQLGIQLCQIADGFHKQKLVHNGLEPNGLIVDPIGRLKLIQFDRVRPARNYDPAIPIYISDGFSAPELYSLNKRSLLDKRSDVYSVGAILYWLLTGEQIPTADHAALRTANWEIYPKAIVSPAFERIIMRSLSYDIEDRYNSVNEMKFALVGLSAPTSIHVGYSTDVGRQRELNEDSLLVLDLRQCFESLNTHIGLYVASDGMGGEAAGEVASRISVRAVAELVTDRLISASLRSTHGSQVAEPTQTGSILLANETGVDVRASQLLTEAITHANAQVLDYAQYHPNTRGLGATLTAVLLVGNVLTVGHVGDSRCYVLSGGRLDQLTEDHSLVERMVQRGEIGREEARTHPHRNIIYRSIGSREDMEIDITTRMLRKGDYILLCSDGLTGMLNDSEIRAVFRRSEDPWHIAKELVVAANARGGEDNISVIVVRVE